MNRDLANHLVVGLEGPRLTGFEEAWIAEHRPAGVILFSRNIIDFNQLEGLCQVLHDLSPGLEIVADHEGGPVSQLALAVGRPPSAWGLGVLDDAGLTARVFRETGQRLGAAGLDRVLAPVADVLTERHNPVIGVRAFGAQSTLVSRHTVAAVTGLLESGLKVCLKHWPGHGGSDRDSHLAETDVGQGALADPFVHGLTAGADAVMVGHLHRRKDPAENGGLPATLDGEFLAASRKQLAAGQGLDLLLFADDITMGALGPAMAGLGVDGPVPLEDGLFDPASLPRAWFEHLARAGCDRFLTRGIPAAAFPLKESSSLGPVSSGTRTSVPPPATSDVYREVRDRLGALAVPGFPDPAKDLVWLDFSQGDRWQAAAGQNDAGTGGGALDLLAKQLEGMFRTVLTPDEAALRQDPVDRLMVSSHRPLPATTSWPENLAPAGVCLALGHPSLQADLEGHLGGKWLVRALYDITPDDLSEGPWGP